MEKSNITGNVSHDPDNHDMMVNLRAQKIKNISNDIPDLKVDGDEKGDLLVLGWGGTYGTLKDATSLAREKGYTVSHTHLQYLNPLPKNTGEVLNNFSKILIPEINLGQLAKYIRSEFLIDVIQFNKVRGLPLNTSDVFDNITDILGGKNDQ